ncbi:hypothetical protein MMC25_003878 [Agyrium rufum]|nr:hypothetical protein [Agyrium rufum]
MATSNEIQDLLRFLTKDAKVPLASAIGNIKDLQSRELKSPARIAKASLEDIKSTFSDEKLAKQILSAAKRVTRKRSSDVDDETQHPKRLRARSNHEAPSPLQIERSLTLPSSDLDEERLRSMVVVCNRAPLVLAFALTLMKYTMPQQPLSSMLSLAQALVSANSRSKAISIGLEKSLPEDDMWSQGQPSIRLMNRDIKVLRRWGYDANDDGSKTNDGLRGQDPNTTDPTSVEPSGRGSGNDDPLNQEVALWGLDLEALRTSNSSSGAANSRRSVSGLPIHTSESARAYLLKSFALADDLSVDPQKTDKKKTAAAQKEEREHAAAGVLQALNMLYTSWVHVLSKEELDRRAWSWYVHVRPEVENGVAGWGSKGTVELSAILNLRREFRS